MPAVRHLRNAPITEAILDFRVQSRPEFLVEEFATLKKQLATRFPVVDEQRGLEATIPMAGGKGQPSVRQLGLQGYFFKTQDLKTIAQFRVDGFTYNRLQPYTSWGELFPEALALWREYCNVAAPRVTTRLALRYINRIPLPSPPFEFERYLQAAPLIPPELPQAVSAFLTRITIHDAAANVAAHISQALENDPQTGRLSVIFDADAFKEGEIAPNDNSEIMAVFEALHSLKNKIFFNGLTEECLRQFE